MHGFLGLENVLEEHLKYRLIYMQSVAYKLNYFSQLPHWQCFVQ